MRFTLTSFRYVFTNASPYLFFLVCVRVCSFGKSYIISVQGTSKVYINFTFPYTFQHNALHSHLFRNFTHYCTLSPATECTKAVRGNTLILNSIKIIEKSLPAWPRDPYSWPNLCRWPSIVFIYPHELCCSSSLEGWNYCSDGSKLEEK